MEPVLSDKEKFARQRSQWRKDIPGKGAQTGATQRTGEGGSSVGLGSAPWRAAQFNLWAMQRGWGESVSLSPQRVAMSRRNHLTWPPSCPTSPVKFSSP